MKPEFTLKIMQWAEELRTRKMQLEKEAVQPMIPGRFAAGTSSQATSALPTFFFGAPPPLLNPGMHRVLSRYFGITTPFNTTEGRDLYEQLALALVDQDAPGAFSQAVADFSEMICRPRNPLCRACVQQDECEAYRHGFAATLPVKEE